MGELITAFVDFGDHGTLRVMVEPSELVVVLKRSSGSVDPLSPKDFSLDLTQLSLVLNEVQPRPDLLNTRWFANSAEEAVQVLREFAKSEGKDTFTLGEMEREIENPVDLVEEFCSLLGIPRGSICWPNKVN